MESIGRKKSIICSMLYLFTIALGAMVVLGWHTNNQSLIQISSTLVPMQYNTALGFILVGVSGVLINRQKAIALLCSGVTFSIGAATLSQYVFNYNLGIDEIFMKHYITTETSHPGRMAPNTALCFMLSSLAVILVILNKNLKLIKLSKINLIIVVLLFSLSIVATLGYIFNINASYGWGSLTKMALHTSIGFFYFLNRTFT